MRSRPRVDTNVSYSHRIITTLAQKLRSDREVGMHGPSTVEESMARSSAQKKVVSPEPEVLVADQSAEVRERIAALAYLKAEARGFSSGHELDDWLEAELEVNGAATGRKR